MDSVNKLDYISSFVYYIRKHYLLTTPISEDEGFTLKTAINVVQTSPVASHIYEDGDITIKYNKFLIEKNDIQIIYFKINDCEYKITYCPITKYSYIFCNGTVF